MKQKTKKAAAKRFTFSKGGKKGGKAQHLHVGQAHFNSRANGNETRRKHHEQSLSPTDRGRLEELLPYSSSGRPKRRRHRKQPASAPDQSRSEDSTLTPSLKS